MEQPDSAGKQEEAPAGPPLPAAKSHHILNGASNLLGVTFVIITGLKLTAYGDRSFADEAALGAAVLLTASCFFSYQSIRGGSDWWEDIADRLFLAAQLLLLGAVSLLWL
ncbi:hypothetical protein F9288_04315 [Sphingomonas sp. CL5.1]|uniref:hypothetical protein n=1 Tax=Sphingomonas sp. CL5.1 TaxID=2653203 RepID=UPI0015841787|nr:hypothetical protein [Sphingomonas sp. CL5.1]QKR98953.1 hypothetical protein F9288_04315 [Sphingomonas sp. CL5.1]